MRLGQRSRLVILLLDHDSALNQHLSYNAARGEDAYRSGSQVPFSRDLHRPLGKLLSITPKTGYKPAVGVKELYSIVSPIADVYLSIGVFRHVRREFQLAPASAKAAKRGDERSCPVISSQALSIATRLDAINNTCPI